MHSGCELCFTGPKGSIKRNPVADNTRFDVDLLTKIAQQSGQLVPNDSRGKLELTARQYFISQGCHKA